jgi:hypothetical protein
MRTWKWRPLLSTLCFVLAGACECGAPPADAGPGGEVGRLVFVSSASGYELVLEDMATPARTLQFHATLQGTRAVALEALGSVSHDVLEADLASPKAEFTGVIANTKRILLREGPLAHLRTEGAGELSADSVLVIDADGQKHPLAAVVR